MTPTCSALQQLDIPHVYVRRIAQTKPPRPRMKHARLQLHSQPFANIEEPNMEKSCTK